MFDLATSVTEGIRNTTTVFDAELDRQRYPRFISSKDKIIKPYDVREAYGSNLLQELDNGSYMNEFYVAHLGNFSLDILRASN